MRRAALAAMVLGMGTTMAVAGQAAAVECSLDLSVGSGAGPAGQLVRIVGTVHASGDGLEAALVRLDVTRTGLSGQSVSRSGRRVAPSPGAPVRIGETVVNMAEGDRLEVTMTIVDEGAEEVCATRLIDLADRGI